MDMNQWVEMRIGDVLTLQRGFDLPSRLRKQGKIPIVSSAGPYDFHDVAQVKSPGVITGRYGTIGDVFFIEEDFWPLNTTLYISDFKGNDPLYISYLLKTVDFVSHSGKSGVPGINRNDIHELRVLRAPLPEQTAIANALSDVDSLIASLETLIAKKSAIKTASMQQLLTGKKRLPGFAKLGTNQAGKQDCDHLADNNSTNEATQIKASLTKGSGQTAPRPGYKQTELGEIPEDWEVGSLNDFVLALEAGISVNSVESMDAFGHGKSILKTSCVSGGYFLPSEGKGIIPSDICRAKMNPKKGNIIISRMNTPALVGEIGYVDDDYQDLYLPDRLWQTKFKPSAKLNSRWLAYILSFPSIAKKIKEAATGTSDSMKNISKPSLLAVSFPCPLPEEQTAIASVLSDMDTELDALQQRLSKTQKIKQGMMQELLTGKTRLI